MAAGLSVADAIKQAAELSRPNCLSCGNPIKMGTLGRHLFCKKTAQCKQAGRRYRYYRYRRGLPPDEALDKVIALLDREQVA
jgi:hypothetical protein